LKCIVKIASATLNDNEKLHLRLVFPNSVNVDNVGTGGFSSKGVIYPAPPCIIGKTDDVVISANCDKSPLKKSLTSTSGSVMLKLKFFYKTKAKNDFNSFRCAFWANSNNPALRTSDEFVLT